MISTVLLLAFSFQSAIAGFDGRVGVCSASAAGMKCANGDQRFSMQSVMKLLVGMAVMDRVDRGGWKLDDPVTVRREDLSVFVQPIAKLVTPAGYKTTIEDLARRAVVDSDSAATDILIARLGGTAEVQAFLDRHGIKGIRIDRDERHLQTETVGLQWKPEYVDPAVLDKAIESVPKETRDAANKRYQTDVRDTATPRAMADLLLRFAEGKLLSAHSTERLWKIMQATVTFPDRLKAGVPAGWAFGHKTGSSGTWNEVTIATNDVGIMRAPDGRWISIVVFIGDSRASSTERAALMAKLASIAASLRYD